MIAGRKKFEYAQICFRLLYSNSALFCGSVRYYTIFLLYQFTIIINFFSVGRTLIAKEELLCKPNYYTELCKKSTRLFVYASLGMEKTVLLTEDHQSGAPYLVK